MNYYQFSLTKRLRIIALCAFFITTASGSLFSQTGGGADRQLVTGIVTDALTGEPLIGVNIVERGAYPFNATATNIDGEFSLWVRNLSATLIVTSIGFNTAYIGVSDRTIIDIELHEATTEIDAVIVTGIFNRREPGFSGSAITVDREQILNLTASNPLRALEALAPGFSMVASNLSGSNPNAIPDFTVRGNASVGDFSPADAEFMRGDFATRTNQPLFVLDGIIGVSPTTIMDLDPEQIESITLLQDAAATAIYGSEAANGVVVITTRTPQAGRLRITYSGNFGIIWPDLSVYNLTNAAEKFEVEMRAGFLNTPPTPGNETAVRDRYNAIRRDILRGVNTDWLAQPLRSVLSHRHALNFEGGGQELRYNIRLGTNFSPGVIKGTGINAQSGSVDIHYRFNRFTIINQVFFNYSRGDRSSHWGHFSTYATLNPYFAPFDENGNIRRILDPQNLGIGAPTGPEQSRPTLNPLYNTLYNFRDEFTELQIRENFRLQYRPTDALRLDLDFQLSHIVGTTSTFIPSHHNAFFFTPQPELRGSFTEQNSNSTDYRLSLTANYNRLFNNAHLISLHGRYTLNQRDRYNSSLQMLGFPNDQLSEIFLGTTFNRVSGAETRTRSLGFVFTGAYSYRDRYAADVSVRVDAASQFGANNRYAPFWSTGVRWNAHNEDFFRSRMGGIFNQFILRTSIGMVGSQDFSPWQALQTYTFAGTTHPYTSSHVVGATLLALGNPDLRWQQTLNQNVALDFSMFNDLFGARFEVYNRVTRNTLLDFSLAPSVGFNTVKENAGEISNRGYEFSVRVMPYRNIARRISWMVQVTGAYNRSTIERISEALERRNAEVFADASARDLTRPLPQFVPGMSTTAIWGMQSVGVDPQTGVEVFQTRGGDHTTVWHPRDLVVIGDRAPTLRGRLNSTFMFRDLTVTLSGAYSFGGDVYNQTLADRVENADLRNNVDRRVLTERWLEPGDVARFVGINGAINRPQTRTTSRFVMRENMFQVAAINATYRMSASDFDFLRQLGVSTAMIGVFSEDIFRLSTIKMERGIHFPFARSISMSLNLTF